jgi:excisionase family DNA binding protein
MPPDEDRLAYTPNELGALLGVDAKTIRRLIESGKLDAINISGGGKQKRWLIPTEAIEAFLGRWRR